MKQLVSMIPEDFKNRVSSMIPNSTKSTILMRAFGLTKVPLLFMTSPKVLEINDQRIKVLIPFRKVVKNHVGSLYFGAMAIGADTAVGMLAMDNSFRTDRKVHMVFKDFKADFLKRAEGDTTFICEQGKEIDKAISETFKTGERVNKAIDCQAIVNNEVVAEFVLTLSVKALRPKH